MRTAFLCIMLPSICNASEGLIALEYAAKAASIELKVDKFAKSLEKKYINKDLRKYGKWTAIIIEAASKKKIQVKWTF